MQKNCQQYLYLISTTETITLPIVYKPKRWVGALKNLYKMITFMIVRDIIRMWAVFRVCR